MLNEILNQNPVFACLDQEARDQAARLASFKDYPVDQWIAHNGSTWAYLFVVAEGIVQAVKESPEGRSLIVTEINTGEIFWGISFFIPEAPMPVALVAKKQTRLYFWTFDDLNPIIMNNGCMSWELTKLMIQKMQYASDMLNEFAFQPTTGRLAKVLLERYGDSAGDYVARDMTLDEMAARIGSTREMVCRHLYHFADQGVIHINRTEFMITDQELLKHLAGKGIN
jgi:CRP-like cAMP-binding protein